LPLSAEISNWSFSMDATFINKKLGLLAVISFSSLLYGSCNLNTQQNPETYQLLEQEISQLEERIVALEEKADDSPMPETNQPLYRNETLGIGFPQPEGTQIQVNDSALFVWTEADYERIEEFVEVTPLYISIEENPDNLTAEEWVFDHGYDLDSDVEAQMVGNQPGVRFDWLGMWIYTSVAVPHPTRPQMVVITWDQDMADYEAFFESVVSDLVWIE
jgi:hypothetical protein